MKLNKIIVKKDVCFRVSIVIVFLSLLGLFIFKDYNKTWLQCLEIVGVYLAVAGIITILKGIEFAWLAPLLLALMPRFWGYMFLDSQNISFHSTFTISIFLGACLIKYFLKTANQEIKLGKNKMTYINSKKD